MIYGGYYLNQAHQNPPNTADEATSRWHSFGYKSEVQEFLLDEQLGLCFYSELRADLEDLGFHIEHIQTKSQYPEKTFDYNNLAASALNDKDLKMRLKEDIFGGHAKLSQYNHDSFISPHNEDCERYFSYLSNGRVIANDQLNNLDKQKANYTIDLLNLNCPYLVNRRRRWYGELVELFDEHIEKSWSIEDLAKIELLPTNKKLNSFFSLTRQFFGVIAERVLQNQ